MPDFLAIAGPQNYAASVVSSAAWASPGAIGSTTPNTGAFTSVTITQSSNSFIDLLSVINANAGTAATTRMTVGLDNVSTALELRYYGSGFTTAATYNVANSGTVIAGSNLVGGLNIVARANAAITFYTNDVGRGSISGAGLWSLGTIGSSFAGNTIAGVQSGAAAVSGQVGEVITSTVSAVAAGGTTATANVTSITLTPGDWDIDGSFTISQGTTGLTTGSVTKASIVTTTGTDGVLGSTMHEDSALLAASGFKYMCAPKLRVNISAGATYYLTANMTYAAGSPTNSGTLSARRIR